MMIKSYLSFTQSTSPFRINSFLSTPISSISAAAKFTLEGIMDTFFITSFKIQS